MISRIMALIVSAIGFVLIGATYALANPPSAENFIAEFSRFAISPNGEYVAMIRPFEGRNALMIQNLANPDDVHIIPSGEGVNIVAHEWYSDDLLFVTVGWATSLRATARPEATSDVRMLAISRDGSETLTLGRFGPGAIIDYLPDDPDHVLLNRWEWQSSYAVGRASLLNVHTGDTRPIARGRSSWGDFVTDMQGNVRILIDGDREMRRVWTRNPGSIEWRLLNEVEHFQSGGISPLKVLDGGRYLYLFSQHEGRRGLYRMELEGSGSMESIFLHEEYDLQTFVWDRQTGEPLYVTYMADTYSHHFFNDEARRHHERINRLLPGANEYIISSDEANNRHIISSTGPGEPPVYYLLDDEARSISELAVGFPGLPREEMASVEAFSYRARDGLEIPSYLAVPPNIGEGPYPLVVWPHGGPHTRENQGFNMLRQFMATRGYAVFVPNFRGSTGYGKSFYSAGLREWGGAMQEDVTDGVQHLIDEGIVDPDRICIVGWSYGGYASMIGLVQTPELYQCGIAINGEYDLREAQREMGRNFNRGAQAWWRFTMGDDTEELIRISPARHADEIEDPVLIIFSEEDRVIEDGQHAIMVNAMREAGVDFEEHIFEEGDHSMNYGPSMIATLEAIEGFLAEHLQ